MKKILVTLFLSLSLLAIIPLGASAAETAVKYSVDGSYTVNIPEYIEADTDSETIEISDVVIPFGYEITMSADYDGELRLRNELGITLPYRLFVNENEYINGTVFLRQNAGKSNVKSSAQLSAKVTEKPIYAGMYQSTVTFDIQVREVTETDYSSEDIEQDPYLFGIGITKPEYVVARFNSDFSAVIITKNGENSDGKMKGWNKPTSPFSENKETLTSVTVKSGVKNIGSTTFMNCTNVTKINLPDGIERIGNDAFGNCEALSSIYLSEDIERIDYRAFSNCSSLKEIRLPSQLDRVSLFLFDGCTSLSQVSLGENISVIEGDAFNGCKSLKALQLPDSLQEIGMWSFRYSGLERIDLPESVTKLGALAFADCKNLTEIHIPSDIAELPDFLLQNCRSLKYIDIPHGVNKIGMQVFSGCNGITELYIPDSVTELSLSALSGLGGLTKFSVSETHSNLCTDDGILYSKDKTQLFLFCCFLGYESAEPIIHIIGQPFTAELRV